MGLKLIESNEKNEIISISELPQGTIFKYESDLYLKIINDLLEEDNLYAVRLDGADGIFINYKISTSQIIKPGTKFEVF